MKRWVVALVLVATSVAYAQPTALREFEPGPVEDRAPTVELVTFGVGPVIFEKWGHSALCLRYNDPARETVCFNYGVTDFGAGAALVWNFLRGQQEFWVEPTSLTSLLGFYSGEDRDIFVQALPLTEEQARKLEARLWRDVTDDKHRYYVYDHFLDNCTTRLRDMIDDATGGKLRADSDAPYPLTFRQLGRRGLAETPSLLVLTDFVVGRQLDAHPTQWQAMFHPEILRDVITTRLGAESRTLHARTGPPFPTTGSTGRLFMFCVALAFAVPIAIARWRQSARGPAGGPLDAGSRRPSGRGPAEIETSRGEKVTTIIAALYLGLWGCVIWGLAAISPIEGIRWNEVLLVLVPLDLALPLFGETARRRYARVRVAGLLLVSALSAVGVLHQPLWIPVFTAILPLAVIAFEDRR